MNKNSKKLLRVNRETVRRLSDEEVGQAQGGAGSIIVVKSQIRLVCNPPIPIPNPTLTSGSVLFTNGVNNY